MLFSTFWGFWGYFVLNRSLGLALFLWSLLFGPLIFLILLSLKRPYLEKALTPVAFSKYPFLCQRYFKSMLQDSGPYPLLYIYPSHEFAYCWLEHPFRNQQIVILSSGFLNMPPEQFSFHWEKLWSSLAKQSRGWRLLRSIEWSFWIANGLPLAFCVKFLEWILNLVRLNTIPRPSFFLQRWCWALRFIWFPHQQSSTDDSFPLNTPYSKVENEYLIPSIWNNFLWGVWFRVSNEKIHPAWKILTHGDAFLPECP
jgi:hypothetical protein